jgi:hypothetical protein
MDSGSTTMANAFVFQELSPPRATYRVLYAIQNAKLAQEPHNLIVPVALKIHLLLTSTPQQVPANQVVDFTFLKIRLLLSVKNACSTAETVLKLPSALNAIYRIISEKSSRKTVKKLVHASSDTTKTQKMHPILSVKNVLLIA